jgi:hypothetical protein
MKPDKDELLSPKGPASSASEEAGGNKDKDEAMDEAMDQAPAASFEHQLKVALKMHMLPNVSVLRLLMCLRLFICKDVLSRCWLLVH